MVSNVPLALIVNSKYSYSFILVFLSLKTIKDLTRVILVNTVFSSKIYKKYAKMFNIKIKDFKKKSKKRVNYRTKANAKVAVNAE